MTHFVTIYVLSVCHVLCDVGPSGKRNPGVSCGSVAVCPDAHRFVR